MKDVRSERLGLGILDALKDARRRGTSKNQVLAGLEHEVDLKRKSHQKLIDFAVWWQGHFWGILEGMV